MGFIKGRAYPIIAAMAKDGNEKAKKLLEGVDSMDQDQVDSMISEIFNSQEKPVGKGILQKEITQGKGRRVRSKDFDYYEQKSREEKQKATLEKTVVPIMPRGGLSKEQQKELNEEKPVGKGILQKELTQGKGRNFRSRDFDYYEQKSREEKQRKAEEAKKSQSFGEQEELKNLFPTLKTETLKAKVNNIAKQVKGQDGTYKIENGKPQEVKLDKGFSVSFFRPEIKNQEAEEIEKIIGDQLGSQYVGVFKGEGELSYNVDQKTANFMAYIFNQKSVWDNKLQKEVDNPNYDPNKKVDYKQAIKELKQLFIDKDLKGA